MIPLSRPDVGKEELKKIEEVLNTRWLGMGSFVYEFEKRIQSYIGVKNAIAVNTGTTAIHMALASLSIGRGDEVIVPSLTFAGSIQPIINLGAKPVFCEVEEDTLNIDTSDAERRITAKTKAIIAVHYGGLACDMDSLLRIAKKRKLYIVEDAAHAFGSAYGGKKIGSFGDLACFSFDPIKNLTCGEGGCVTTNSSKMAETLRRKRLLGISKDTWMRYKHKRSWSYEVVTEGYRYHMSNINAAIGLAQFDKFEKFMIKKRSIIRRYDEALEGIDGISLLRRDYEAMSPFNYTIKIKDRRDEFIKHMEKGGISVGVNYIPNHTQPFFKKFSSRLPVTEMLGEQIASIPLYSEMTDDDIKTVIKAAKGFEKDGTG